MSKQKNLLDFFKVLSKDETLMRLLYYTSKNSLDSPLSPTKPNLINTDIYINNIMKQRLLRSANADGLVIGNEGICRICMYMGTATRTANEKIYRQRINIDVFVNINKYEVIDNRSTLIIDRINKLILGKKITGMGRVQKLDSSPIAAPEGYVGFTNVYSFWSAS
ncbi:MAG: hypothetical protein ACI35O_02425 [Bacillaceae bacterium]